MEMLAPAAVVDLGVEAEEALWPPSPLEEVVVVIATEEMVDRTLP